MRASEGYGSTEAHSIASNGTVADRVQVVLRELSHGDCGGALACLGRRRERGEILVRAPALFSGYWNDEEATAEAFVEVEVDEVDEGESGFESGFDAGFPGERRRRKRRRKEKGGG